MQEKNAVETADAELPPQKIGDWIKIGQNGIDAVVLGVQQRSLHVGYFQNDLKAIGDDVVWNGEFWEFETSGPSGVYLQGRDAWLVKRGAANRGSHE